MRMTGARWLGAWVLALAWTGVASAQEADIPLQARWQKLLRAGQVDEAFQLLAPRVATGDVEARSLQATTLYHARRYGEAIELLQHLLNEGVHLPPSHVRGWFWVRIGYCHEAQGDYSEAGAAYGRAYAERGDTGYVEKAQEALERVRKAVLQSRTIAFVEAFGGNEADRAQALKLCGLRAGDPAQADALRAAKQNLRASGAFQYADLFSWQESAGEIGVLIDLVGPGEPPPPPLNPSVQGEAIPLPPPVLDAARRYGGTFQRALQGDEQARQQLVALEAELSEIAEAHLDTLLAALTHSSESEGVAASAHVLGYLQVSARIQEAAQALGRRFDDPHPSVRNAALRAAALLEEQHGEALGPLADPEAVLRALERPSVLDRQKACGILAALARHETMRARLRDVAYERARAIAGTRLTMHRRGGLALLRELEGETRLSDAEWRAWLEQEQPESLRWWDWVQAQRANQQRE